MSSAVEITGLDIKVHKEMLFVAPFVSCGVAAVTIWGATTTGPADWFDVFRDGVVNIGGIYVFARYSLPDHDHTTAEHIGYGFFFLLHCTESALIVFRLGIPGFGGSNSLCWLWLWLFVYGEKQLLVLKLSFLFSHNVLFFSLLFLLAGPKSDQPPTYAKYLFVPCIILAVVALIGSTFDPLYLILVFMVMLPYIVVAVIYLLFADEPIDKSRRTTTVNGMTRKHIITKDGYYFVVSPHSSPQAPLFPTC